MIRPTTIADTPVLLALTKETGIFKPIELDALHEVLEDYHAGNHEDGHFSITYEDAGSIVGFAYYAPAAMTDRTWYLYWIVIAKQLQGKGIGGALLTHAVEQMIERGGRILLIETSSLPSYDLTRRFYVKHGYDQAAVLKDYYADGDDMVVFRKRLAP